MMIRVLKHLAALLLCFCVICSLCGITFASGVDPDKIQMLEDWALSLEASASPDPESSGDPFGSVPEASEALPDSEPEPSDFSFTDVRPSDVDDPSFADVPGGDVPALDFDDIASDPPSAGGDGTYIVLPDDFIIQSAGYDDTMSIDPFSLAPITPGNTSGLKAVLLSILGNYDPIVAQYGEMVKKLSEFQTLTAKATTVNPKLTALNVELAQVEDEIEKLLNTLTGANAVLLSYANGKIEELDANRQRLIKEIAALNAETISPQKIEFLSAHLDNWNNIDFDDRRRVTDIILSQVQATSDRVSFEWKI